MKARLIVNPVAGRDDAPDELQELNERLRARVTTLDMVLTTGADDARAAGRDAAASEYDYVLVAGGDGTLNHVINGAGSVAGALGRVVFGVVPYGTGNDFARALGFPDNRADALDVLVSKAEPRAVDVGRVNGRLFVNTSSGGFVADVSVAVDPSLKTLAGRLAFAIGAAKVLKDAEPFACRLSGTERQCLMYVVCNAPTMGGGRLIAPDAAIDDGLLDVCIVSAMPMLEFVNLLRKVADGEHVADARVEYFQTASARLEFDRSIHVNADGEVFEAQACDYTVLPRAAQFLAP